MGPTWGKRRDLALVSRKNTSVENGVLGVLKFGHTHGHGGTLDIFTLMFLLRYNSADVALA